MMQAFSMRMRGRALGGGVIDDYAADLVRAFSTRLLLSEYSGPLFRLQRSSDSTELDCNTVAEAETFVGAGNGTVTRLYDQSGSGTYVSNLGTPTLIGGGVTYTLAGGAHPAIYINAIGEGFSGLPSVKSLSRTAFARASINSGGVGVLVSRPISLGYAGVYQNGSTSGFVERATGSQYLDGVSATRDQAHDGLASNDAIWSVAFTADSTSEWDTPRVFAYPVSVTSLAYMTDFVMFDSELGAVDVATISGVLGA